MLTPQTLLFASCLFICVLAKASDITDIVFGSSSSEGIIGAFGDFNSDELTDVFILKNNGKTLEVLLGSDVEPLLRHEPSMKCEFKNLEITSIVPGDFDGDAFMDVLITTKTQNPLELGVYINWGMSDALNCTDETKQPIIQMKGEPVALDYNQDMIIDLFGLDLHGNRTFWVFNSDRKPPNISRLQNKKMSSKLAIPHSHAYLDLNNDFTADLFITTEEHFEEWHGLEHEGFEYSHKIDLPIGNLNHIVGQSLFLDLELKGSLNQILPICFDLKCQNSTLLVRTGTKFHNLEVNFKDDNNANWGFVVPKKDQVYINTITLRGGDFNMDGYPDLLVTLAKPAGQPQTFLLENVPCEGNACQLSRTFKIRWQALAPFSNGTIMGAFYDFYQDGILDVIFVEQTGDRYRQVAFRNTLDYDANFVKVIVLTGLTNKRDPTKLTPLGRKKRTYGELSSIIFKRNIV